MDLRTVAASPWEQDLVAVAHRGGVVDVWSLARDERLASLTPLHDGVWWRGAVVPGDRPLVVAGAWERHGVRGYDLSGEVLWQDRSRTNVHGVTALASGRVVVTYSRRATRVLDAATGEELRTLRGVLRLVPLTPDLSLAVGGGWCRLLDRDLEPLGSRVPTGLTTVWSAATDGEHLVVSELGDGPSRVLDRDGRERATLPAFFRVLAHTPGTATWVGVHEAESGNRLVRFANSGEVVERHPLPALRDAAFVRDGRTLAVLTDDGVDLVDCADGSTRRLGAGRS